MLQQEKKVNETKMRDRDQKQNRENRALNGMKNENIAVQTENLSFS